jgi:hypothetical protein
MGIFSYVNNRYGLQLKRGSIIEYKGKRGHVTHSSGGYIFVILDGEKQSRRYHPTWGITHIKNNKPEECLCYNCFVLKKIKRATPIKPAVIDCGCENMPFYDKEMCGSCKHKKYCDVPAHPELYKKE